MFAAPQGCPLLALALLAGPLLAGAAAARSEESAPDLLARAKHTLDDADSAHFVLEQRGRARHRHRAGRRRGRHRPARRRSRAR